MCASSRIFNQVCIVNMWNEFTKNVENWLDGRKSAKKAAKRALADASQTTTSSTETVDRNSSLHVCIETIHATRCINPDTGSVFHCAFSLVLSCLKRSMVVMSDCVSNGYNSVGLVYLYLLFFNFF